MWVHEKQFSTKKNTIVSFDDHSVPLQTVVKCPQITLRLGIMNRLKHIVYQLFGFAFFRLIQSLNIDQNNPS